MKTVWVFLLVATFSAGCGSFGKSRSTDEIVVEVTGYRMWKEVFFFDGRVDSQWMLLGKVVSPKTRSSKELDIVVTERDKLFQCPTGTVLKCNIDSQAISAWERVARREVENLDPVAMRASAAENEQKARALERTKGRNTAGASDVAEARQAADEAWNKLRQAELYLGALVVKAVDIVGFEVIKEGPGN